MPATTPTYDLLLLLSIEAIDDERAKIVADVESAVASGGGTVTRRDDWGRRPLSYRINHEAEAEYHLLQFSGPTELLESLSHSLRINDGVLRFRIIKVLAGQPPPPDAAPPIVATAVPAAASTASEPAPTTPAAAEPEPAAPEPEPVAPSPAAAAVAADSPDDAATPD
jgi:small subunit ribosomal protein S6